MLACCFILQNNMEMSEESSSTDEHTEIFKNLGTTHLPVLKIEKLKREDDDEQWISGEELNTDGSSDEKGKTTSTKSRRRSKAHVKAKITAKDTEPEEKTLASMNETNEVFLNIIKKVNDLQASFPKFIAKEKTASLPRVDDTNSTAAESASNDKPENLFSSESLLQAYKQIERLDCVFAKYQEARRAEEALRRTINPEEVVPQVCSEERKYFKHEGGVKGAVDNHGPLLPKGREDKEITIPTKPPVNYGFKISFKKGTHNENLESSDILETNSKNLINSEDTNTAQDKKPSQHFIKRNIKLATEGHKMGSLATITDEERIQLDHLLEDLDQNEQALINGVGDRVFEESAYSICSDTMGSIVEIDQKLEKIDEERYCKGDQRRLDSENKPGRDEDAEVDSKRLRKEADAVMNLKRRLNEINKTLDSLNEPSKEIEPIEESRIQQLIDEFYGISTVKNGADSSGTEETACEVHEGNYSADTLETDDPNSATREDEGKHIEENLVLAENLLSSERVKEIVELTKCQMPCFKYRHQEHSSEK